MSFICCDAEGSHDIVAILENRLTKTIREHFMNRYTNRERAAVKSVVVDLNAQYIKFIKALFTNARIIIDRFHIVQLVGRALGNARISLMLTTTVLNLIFNLFFIVGLKLGVAGSVMPV